MVGSRSSLTSFQDILIRREGGRIGKERLSRDPKQLFKNQLTVYDMIIIIMILVCDSITIIIMLKIS